MELGISILTQPIAAWTTSSRGALLHFIGVLSLDLDQYTLGQYGFVPVAQSTSILSSLI